MATFDTKTGDQVQSAQEDFAQSTQVPLAKDDILKIIREYNESGGFTDRKLTDTPTDAFAVVNRKFVTLNGATSNRPPKPVVGQFYLDTSLGAHGKPIWWTTAGWIDATSTLV